MNKNLVLLVVVVLAGLVGLYLFSGRSGRVAGTETTAGQQDGPRVVRVVGGNFSFDPVEIKVEKGEEIRVMFTNQEGFHDWVVDEFSARTKQIRAGETDSAEFVADKTGTFEYYCSVGEHRQKEMRGNLVVE